MSLGNFINVSLLLLILLSLHSLAHVEEYCIEQGTGIPKPFFAKPNALKCGFKSWRPICVIDVSKVSGATFRYTSNCRGMVHYDAVFYLAQAAGFSGELAYWISAFSQAVDFVQFEALDSCGNELPQRYWTPPLRGFLRTSTVTGGTIHHLGIPFGELPEGYSGLSPDLDNYENEGSLATFRDWAMGNSQQICTGGFRTPVDGNYFVGEECLSPSVTVDDQSSNAVSGPIPLMQVGVEFGPALAHYSCLNDTQCSGTNITMVDKVYARDLESYMEQQSNFSRLDSGQVVPVEIAKLGIFMHYLADRASHYWCTDPAGNTITEDHDEDGDLYLKLSVKDCNAVLHGMEHYWEQMVGKPLAPQSYAAMNLNFEQLLVFRELHESKHPDWFVREAHTNISQVIGTASENGILDTIIKMTDSQQRYNDYLLALDDSGYQRPPGWERACSNIRKVSASAPTVEEESYVR